MLEALFLSLVEAFSELKDLSSEHLVFGFVSGFTSGSLNCSSDGRYKTQVANWNFAGWEFCRLGILQVRNYAGWNFAGWEFAGYNFAGWEFCKLGIMQVRILQVGNLQVIILQVARNFSSLMQT
jgi:hypothetical protein